MPYDQIISDLMAKVGDDVSRSINRVRLICPKPHLPIAVSGASAALGCVAAELDQLAGHDMSKGPADKSIMLGALMAARLGMSGSGDAQEALALAYKDFAALQAAGLVGGES